VTGRFVTLEGGEGAGKSTQLRALADALRALGIDVIETREPGGSEGAEAIRRLLLEGGHDRWSPRVEALLFAAARADHVEKVIRPALADGRWVICDRYVDSSIAYQGRADGLGSDAIRTLHQLGSEGFLPDRTLLLALPPVEASARAAERDRGASDRIGARDALYHTSVAAAFEQLALAEPSRFRRIDALGPPEAVTGRILEALRDLLP